MSELVEACKKLNTLYKKNKELKIMDNINNSGKYNRLDGDGIRELFNLYKTNFIEFKGEINKYDKQLFNYELENCKERDEVISEFVDIYKFMVAVYYEINKELDNDLF